MYLLLLLGPIALGIWLFANGNRTNRNARKVAGGILVAVTIAFFSVLGLWTEALWFHEIGFARRFWLLLLLPIGLAAACATLGAAVVWLLTRALGSVRKPLRYWPEAAGAIIGGIHGFAGWESVLILVNRVTTGISEPVLGFDAGFYMFVLPAFDLLQSLLTWLVLIVVATTVVALNLRKDRGETDTPGARTAILTASLALAFVLGLGFLRAAFHLLYSELGIVTGPGWTDINVRLPAFVGLAIASPLLIASLFVPAIRRLAARPTRQFFTKNSETLPASATAWATLGAAWIVAAIAGPWLAQRLLVEPNEITRERPYIANNIALTRQAFDLDDIEERQYPAAETLSRETIDDNQSLISEIRLWDWRALDAVYRQFQEIRLYYEFEDVDIDRYRFDGRYRQVMVSARELEQRNLPEGSQTFVNRRFKYTHGYGITMTPVSDFTPSGLPNLLIRDIPPTSRFPELEVERPEIYFGELSRTAVVTRTDEPEFDYPSGEENVYTHYEGDGGVRIGNLWRKFVFGWRYGGTPFLFSGYPNPESRILLHRQVSERVQHIAPFLVFENDPYIVLADGRLYWIIDAYTRSDRFPYSTHFDATEFSASGTADSAAATRGFHGDNYLRNSVKAVVDAYNGDVDFYVFEDEDPVLQVWRNALPGMFSSRDSMPESLRQHVRYPQGMLLTQGLVYAKYHMQDPVVFYNQEDLWVRATEKHRGDVIAVEPYYVMWEPPGTDEPEFTLMLPFTPKDRQVMIGWIAGLSDGDNYGRFLAYKFPKEKRVLGTQQVETKIDQDRFLSGQLTLWDQRGSNVLRGNVLAIPLDDTLLYVEPIYLRAETAAYPELRIVVVMHNDEMSYGETFEDALTGLFTERRTDTGTVPLRQLAADAQSAFEDYLTAQGEAQFDDAARALAALENSLARMAAAEPQEP